MDRNTYPVWIGCETAIRFHSNETGHRAHLVIDHGREGDPSITLVGPILQMHRLVMEADRELTRWRIDNSPVTVQLVRRVVGASRGFR